MKRLIGIPDPRLVCLVVGIVTCFHAQAAVIDFGGQLDVVQEDIGGAVYSGVPIGSSFFGSIDDVTMNGFISDGTTLTSFGCCIAAGGPSVTNDEVLDAETAAFLNSLSGSFAEGDLIDIVNIEGDVVTPGGGRLEIGLSFALERSGERECRSRLDRCVG